MGAAAPVLHLLNWCRSTLSQRGRNSRKESLSQHGRNSRKESLSQRGRNSRKDSDNS